MLGEIWRVNSTQLMAYVEDRGLIKKIANNYPEFKVVSERYDEHGPCGVQYLVDTKYKRILRRLLSVNMDGSEFDHDTYRVQSKLSLHKQRARKKALPRNIKQKEWKQILADFGGRCALTLTEQNITMEHFIPLVVGHGGTIKGNVYPLTRSLNASKSGANPFEWIRREDLPCAVSDIQWQRLIKYLATQNGLTVDEFREFVNWCFEHPRSPEEIDSEFCSITLWKKSKTAYHAA